MTQQAERQAGISGEPVVRLVNVTKRIGKRTIIDKLTLDELLDCPEAESEAHNQAYRYLKLLKVATACTNVNVKQFHELCKQ